MASEFDTLEELRASLSEQAGQEARYQQGIQARERLLEKLLEGVEIPVPDGIIKAEVKQHLEQENKAEDDPHGEEVEVEARKAFKAQLLLDAIAEKEEVQVGQQELIEYLLASAQQYRMDPNEFIKAVDQAGQVPSMVAEVGRRKALAQVLERAKVKDESGNEIDLSELFPATEAEELEGETIEGETVEEIEAAEQEEQGEQAPAKKADDPTALPTL